MTKKTTADEKKEKSDAETERDAAYAKADAKVEAEKRKADLEHQKTLAAALHKRGESVPGIFLQVCGIVPGGWDPLGRGRLPRGIKPMTSDELEERDERIAARNARIQEERAERAATAANPDRRGFNLPLEGWD